MLYEKSRSFPYRSFEKSEILSSFDVYVFLLSFLIGKPFHIGKRRLLDVLQFIVDLVVA